MTTRLIWSPKLLVALATVALLALAAPGGSADAARKKKPDLRVTAVTVPAEAVRGGGFDVNDTVKNAGRVKAKRSFSVTYLLSTDTKPDSADDDLRGGRTIGKLGPKKSSTATTNVLTASVTPTGTYYVIACADSNDVIAEKHEGNNCTASTTTIELKTKVIGGGAR